MVMRAFLCLSIFLLAAGCSRDPNVVKKRYVDNGNKYYDRGKFREARIMYRNALQKDQKYGEAYYRLGLTGLQMGQGSDAVQMLRRAVELLRPDQPERTDARIDRKSTRLNSSHTSVSRMPSSA